TYVVTLVTNPAISIPCGIDEHAMPFGLQVTGRFRGDRELLDAAEAMEQAFANIPGLGRPRPDLGKLARPTADLKSIVTHPPLQAATAECRLSVVKFSGAPIDFDQRFGGFSTCV